jgi:hypothetical protein
MKKGAKITSNYGIPKATAKVSPIMLVPSVQAFLRSGKNTKNGKKSIDKKTLVQCI